MSSSVGSKVEEFSVVVEKLGSIVEVDCVESADVEVEEVTVCVLRQRLLRDVFSESDSPSSSVFSQS